MHKLLEKIAIEQVPDSTIADPSGWWRILDVGQAETLAAHLLLRGAFVEHKESAPDGAKHKYITSPDKATLMAYPANGEPLPPLVWSVHTENTDLFLTEGG